MRDYSTSSGLSREGKCAPSATLPRMDAASLPADVGSAKHEHLEHRAAFGVDEAMAKVHDVARRWGLDERESTFLAAWARKFEWSPPPGSFGEVSLAMFEDGRVERTTGGKGKYPELEPGGRLEGAILAGQNDVMWSEPAPLDLSDPAHPKCPPGSVLWVGDYKGGTDAFVDPVESNLQIAANAVMTARWTGATSVVPFVLYLEPPRGDWEVPSVDGQPVAWGPRDLAQAEERVREVLKRRRAMIERARAGEPIDGWNEGPWCTFCPGRLTCPAKVEMLRRTAAIATVPKGERTALTAEELAWWAVRLSQMESAIKRAREYLQEHTDLNGPLDLGGGLLWGKRPSRKEKLIPHVALPILQEELGPDVLDSIASVSKSAIEEVVKADHEAKGIRRQRSKAVGRILGRIREAEGVREELGVTFGPYRATEALEEGKADEEAAAQ